MPRWSKYEIILVHGGKEAERKVSQIFKIWCEFQGRNSAVVGKSSRVKLLHAAQLVARYVKFIGNLNSVF
jgi:hypothetical protein